jgi:hypothetical protein
MASIETVLDEALKLEPDDRARVVAELLATLEPDVPSQQRPGLEWIKEIERRTRAAVQGSAGASWAEAKKRIQTPPNSS